MTTAERIQVLLHRHSKEEVAAILGTTDTDVASFDFDHSDVPHLASAFDQDTITLGLDDEVPEDGVTFGWVGDAFRVTGEPAAGYTTVRIGDDDVPTIVLHTADDQVTMTGNTAEGEKGFEIGWGDADGGYLDLRGTAPAAYLGSRTLTQDGDDYVDPFLTDFESRIAALEGP